MDYQLVLMGLVVLVATGLFIFIRRENARLEALIAKEATDRKDTVFFLVREGSGSSVQGFALKREKVEQIKLAVGGLEVTAGDLVYTGLTIVGALAKAGAISIHSVADEDRTLLTVTADPAYKQLVSLVWDYSLNEELLPLSQAEKKRRFKIIRPTEER